MNVKLMDRIRGGVRPIITDDYTGEGPPGVKIQFFPGTLPKGWFIFNVKEGNEKCLGVPFLEAILGVDIFFSAI